MNDDIVCDVVASLQKRFNALPSQCSRRQPMFDAQGREYLVVYTTIPTSLDGREGAIASNTPDFRENKEYLAAFQARDLSDLGEMQKIRKIAKKLDPTRMLVASGDPTIGAPVVWKSEDDKYYVLGGNGRTIAFLIAPQERYDEYVNEARGRWSNIYNPQTKRGYRNLLVRDVYHSDGSSLSMDEAIKLAGASQESTAGKETPLRQGLSRARGMGVTEEADIPAIEYPLPLNKSTIRRFIQLNAPFWNYVKSLSPDYIRQQLENLNEQSLPIALEQIEAVLIGRYLPSRFVQKGFGSDKEERAIIGVLPSLASLQQLVDNEQAKPEYNLLDKLEAARDFMEQYRNKSYGDALADYEQQCKQQMLLMGVEPSPVCELNRLGVAFGLYLKRMVGITDPTKGVKDINKYIDEAAKDKPYQTGMFGASFGGNTEDKAADLLIKYALPKSVGAKLMTNPSDTWIQDAFKEIDDEGTEGSFTRYAASKGYTTVEGRKKLAEKIVKSYENWKKGGKKGRPLYTLRTYRRALMLLNLSKNPPEDISDSYILIAKNLTSRFKNLASIEGKKIKDRVRPTFLSDKNKNIKVGKGDVLTAKRDIMVRLPVGVGRDGVGYIKKGSLVEVTDATSRGDTKAKLVSGEGAVFEPDTDEIVYKLKTGRSFALSDGFTMGNAPYDFGYIDTNVWDTDIKKATKRARIKQAFKDHEEAKRQKGERYWKEMEDLKKSDPVKYFMKLVKRSFSSFDKMWIRVAFNEVSEQPRSVQREFAVRVAEYLDLGNWIRKQPLYKNNYAELLLDDLLDKGSIQIESREKAREKRWRNILKRYRTSKGGDKEATNLLRQFGRKLLWFAPPEDLPNVVEAWLNNSLNDLHNKILKEGRAYLPEEEQEKGVSFYFERFKDAFEDSNIEEIYRIMYDIKTGEHGFKIKQEFAKKIAEYLDAILKQKKLPVYVDVSLKDYKDTEELALDELRDKAKSIIEIDKEDKDKSNWRLILIKHHKGDASATKLLQKKGEELVPNLRLQDTVNAVAWWLEGRLDEFIEMAKRENRIKTEEKQEPKPKKQDIYSKEYMYENFQKQYEDQRLPKEVFDLFKEAYEDKKILMVEALIGLMSSDYDYKIRNMFAKKLAQYLGVYDGDDHEYLGDLLPQLKRTAIDRLKNEPKKQESTLKTYRVAPDVADLVFVHDEDGTKIELVSQVEKAKFSEIREIIKRNSSHRGWNWSRNLGAYVPSPRAKRANIGQEYPQQWFISNWDRVADKLLSDGYEVFIYKEIDPRLKDNYLLEDTKDLVSLMELLEGKKEEETKEKLIDAQKSKTISLSKNLPKCRYMKAVIRPDKYANNNTEAKKLKCPIGTFLIEQRGPMGIKNSIYRYFDEYIKEPQNTDLPILALFEGQKNKNYPLSAPYYSLLIQTYYKTLGYDVCRTSVKGGVSGSGNFLIYLDENADLTESGFGSKSIEPIVYLPFPTKDDLLNFTENSVDKWIKKAKESRSGKSYMEVNTYENNDFSFPVSSLLHFVIGDDGEVTYSYLFEVLGIFRAIVVNYKGKLEVFSAVDRVYNRKNRTTTTKIFPIFPDEIITNSKDMKLVDDAIAACKKVSEDYLVKKKAQEEKKASSQKRRTSAKPTITLYDKDGKAVQKEVPNKGYIGEKFSILKRGKTGSYSSPFILIYVPTGQVITERSGMGGSNTIRFSKLKKGKAVMKALNEHFVAPKEYPKGYEIDEYKNKEDKPFVDEMSRVIAKHTEYTLQNSQWE